MDPERGGRLGIQPERVGREQSVRMYVGGMGVHGGAESCQGGLELAHGDPLPAYSP